MLTKISEHEYKSYVYFNMLFLDSYSSYTHGFISLFQGDNCFIIYLLCIMNKSVNYWDVCTLKCLKECIGLCDIKSENHCSIHVKEGFLTITMTKSILYIENQNIYSKSNMDISHNRVSRQKMILLNCNNN